MALTRRQLLSRSALLGASGLLPGALRASPLAANDRKFLFLFCVGGWDPTWVFAPILGSDNVDVDPDGASSTVGGITFMDGPGRPSVSQFFSQYASRTCVLNGFEVRGVAHERCRRLLFTGTSSAEADDWPSTIAGLSTGYLLPDLVISGPAYTSSYTTSVMRVGETGQLSGLLDGSALSTYDPPILAPSASSQAAVDAFLDARISAFEASAGLGRGRRFASDLATARDQLGLVRSLTDLDLSIEVNGVVTPVSTRVQPALDCFERGYSRVAVAQHAGQYELGWDNHTGISQQAAHYEVLFSDLLTILQDLEHRTGTTGRPLSEEVVVVVCSEMGRTPKLNTSGGKDHWTFTSAMFIGPGVRGGQVVGAYDDTLVGRPVDVATGQPADDGLALSSSNLGATLLALAGLDPGDEAPIDAVLA